ncbi:uncharacterized protein LOC110267885 [Arachis ipaensis]|uniref:uncharacterized protein LOC110267885 n=1 Tax=Arachis ipaensis TaxID=130454 RepID=UPI000A2B67AC|nr:uncharacterized protein LOC110267885 [Arachis ipaensis]
MREPEGGEEEDRDESASERPESERGSPLQHRCSRRHHHRGGGSPEEREKDDSQTRWRERTKTRRERGGCSAVHCRRSWGQLKPPPLLGLAVLLSSLSASTITSCVSSVPFSTPRVRIQFSLLKSSTAISPDLFFRFRFLFGLVFSIRF